MKKIISFASLIAIGLTFLPVAKAAEFLAPEKFETGKSAQSITVSSGETHKNLYVVGGNVTVNSNTLGDLVAAGGMVNIDGNVEKDLFVFSGNISVNGSVGENARIAGGNMIINSQVGGDLLIGGGNITINEKSSITGDLVIGGGNVTVNAPVKGNVKIAGGNVTLNSKVGGEVKAEVTQQLVFGPKADISSKVFYKAPKQAIFKPGSNVPNPVFEQLKTRPLGRNFGAILTLAFLIKLLAWVLAGWLYLRFRKNSFQQLADSVQKKPWESLGVGLAAFILIPIAVILLFVSLVGYYIALLALFSYVLVLILVCLLSALFLGSTILRYLSKLPENPTNWQAIVIGVVIWSLLRFIPFVGWLIMAIIFLMVFGGAIKMIKQRITNP